MGKHTPLFTKEQLVRWIESGKTGHEIADMLGCDIETVRVYVKKYDIQPPTRFYYSTIRNRKKAVWTDEARKKMSDRYKGKGHPQYGTKHSEERRKNQGNRYHDITGENNPYVKSLRKSEDARAAASQRAKERWANYSEEEKQRLLERSVHDNALFKGRRIAHGWYTSPKAGKVYYKSGWEYAVIEYLDKTSLVLSYQVEPFFIPYIDINGRARRTLPDFLVELNTGEQIMLEVKPKRMTTYLNNPYKIAGQKAYCQKHNIKHYVVTDTDDAALANILELATKGLGYK